MNVDRALQRLQRDLPGEWKNQHGARVVVYMLAVERPTEPARVAIQLRPGLGVPDELSEYVQWGDGLVGFGIGRTLRAALRDARERLERLRREHVCSTCGRSLL